MAKINVLPAKVYNRIAAGEVIDRPYSIVKELVENSIDAGATEIEIYIEQGGKQLVRVVDNGCGIERDDLYSAYLAHATSKISKAEDLETIRTLGFRGEAVASIAAVSKMTITSKVAGEKCYQLSCNGGEIGSVTEASGGQGTEVCVEMLFYNAPVRLGFLKTDKGEEADITTFVSRFILNRSDIAFTYYANGKKILQSFGGGDEEALVCVYGAAVRAQCIEINAEKHGVLIRGYIGNQNFSKPNKSYQNAFLNGRYVSNATISAAIAGAYASYLMKRQYPFYVLHITVPPQVVDVNVHPNKADVRFAENNTIYGCIYSVISAVLDGKSAALDYVVQEKTEEETPAIETKAEAFTFDELPAVNEAPKTQETTTLSESILAKSEWFDTVEGVHESEREQELKPAVFDTKKTSDIKKAYGFDTFTYEDAKKEMEASTSAFTALKNQTKADAPKKGFTPASEFKDYNDIELIEIDPTNPRPHRKPNPEKLLKLYPGLRVKSEILKFNDPAYEEANGAEEAVDYFAQNKRFLEELDAKTKQDKIDVSSCVYAGKLFNTYLLYECNADVYIIDQHAAHERLIFDRLKARMRDRNVPRQPMLLPFELQVNPMEGAFLREKMKEINEMGFDISETYENVFAVSSIPVDLPKIDLGAFFNQILFDIDGYRGIRLEEVLKDKLASAACKAAVKGGMDLTREEIEELLKQMDGDMGLKCPHGRPVVVKMTRTELEKMFKRIV